MVYKSHSGENSKNFSFMFKNRLNANIAHIRANNFKESCTGSIMHLYSSHHCISHQTSSVESPQHNEIIERTNKHVLEVSRAFSFNQSFMSSIGEIVINVQPILSTELQCKIFIICLLMKLYTISNQIILL